MTVLNVKLEKKAGVRTAEHLLEDRQITRRQTEQYTVETDGVDDAETVLNSPSVKQIYNLHASDSSSRVIRTRASQREEKPELFTVDVEYSTAAAGSEEEEEPDPLNEDAEVSWNTAAVNVVAEKDRNDNAILNKAGDAFDPPIEVERPHAVLTVTRNQASFNGSTALAYVQKVNSAVFAGGAVGTVMCRSISATDEIKNNIQYWRVTYEFEYAPEGWQPEILEQGLRDANGDPLKGDDGDDVTTPVPIDSSGDRITTGLPSAAIFTTFNVYEETNFNSLGLTV